MNEQVPSKEKFRTYKRVGAIEARPYERGDQATLNISISEADLALPTLVGGMVARNPDNHDDMWYIAAAYFAKHYSADEPGLLHGVPRDRAIWICSVCNGWNHVRDKFCTHTHAANAEGGAPVNMLVADSAQPPCDDLKEATRLLHVVNAWCWRASDDPDPARVDPLYPSRGVHNSKAPLFTAIRALLDRHPYGGPSLTKEVRHD